MILLKMEARNEWKLLSHELANWFLPYTLAHVTPGPHSQR